MSLTERDRACFGPRNIKQVGSVEWCWQTIDLLKIRWQRKDFTDQQFEETLDELRQQAVWQVVPPEQPYGSLEALLKAEIGCTEPEARQELLAQAHPKEGRPEKLAIFASFNQKDRAEQNGVSIFTQRKLDYLAGHNQALLQDVQAGTLAIDRAYKLAKGIAPDTPLAVLQRAWRRVPREDRVRFVREMLTEAERAELAEELLAIETRL